MRNRINRMITYRIPEQASISEADFHWLATRICEGNEQIRKSIITVFIPLIEPFNDGDTPIRMYI